MKHDFYEQQQNPQEQDQKHDQYYDLNHGNQDWYH